MAIKRVYIMGEIYWRTIMSDYDTYIEHRGKKYRYDSDYDCFYPVNPPMSTWDKISPLVTILILLVLVLIIDYVKQ